MTIDDVNVTDDSPKLEKVLGKLTGDYTGSLGTPETAAEVLLNKLAENGVGSSDTPVTSYAQLTNKPTINGVTLTGNRTSDELMLNYASLMNKPTINGEEVAGNMILTLGTSNYNELDNKPSINGIELTGDTRFVFGVTSYMDIADKPKINGKTLRDNIELELGVKSYNDIEDKPTLNGETITGDVTIENATVNEPGLMSAEDKKKLDDIADSADQNRIETISVNGTIITPDSMKNVEISLDDIYQKKLSVGVNINLTEDGTINAVDTKYSAGDNITIDSDNKISASVPKVPSINYESVSIDPDDWNNNQFSVENSKPAASYNMDVRLDGDNCTATQYDAWNNAKIVIMSTSNTLKILGTVPSTIIPIILKYTSKQ